MKRTITLIALLTIIFLIGCKNQSKRYAVFNLDGKTILKIEMKKNQSIYDFDNLANEIADKNIINENFEYCEVKNGKPTICLP